MIGLLKSMATTMKHALDGNTFTVEYPEEAPEVSPRFRGVHKFSQERCIWCRSDRRSRTAGTRCTAPG